MTYTNYQNNNVKNRLSLGWVNISPKGDIILTQPLPNFGLNQFLVKPLPTAKSWVKGFFGLTQLSGKSGLMSFSENQVLTIYRRKTNWVKENWALTQLETLNNKTDSMVSPFSKTDENKNGLNIEIPTVKAKSVFYRSFRTERTCLRPFLYCERTSLFSDTGMLNNKVKLWKT